MNNFNFKKKFGQNFLQNTKIIDKIIEEAEINKETLVIEIGPGSGNLTKKICEQAGFVLAYEIDKDLEDTLNNNLKNYNNYKIIWKDFLKENIKKEIENISKEKNYIIANLPYYITTPIINKIIENKLDTDKIIIMVQKEVGERINALPGSRNYGSLTVFLNYYYDIRKVVDVPRANFYPKPNVDSIVIELKKKEQVKINKEVFFKLVKDSFKFKRKNIKNNLKEYDLTKLEQILKKYNLDLNVRAEALSLEIFIDIANNL